MLDQKHQEIGVLKHQLESYENGQKGVVRDYESQLNRLKCQLKNLKVNGNDTGVYNYTYNYAAYCNERI